MAEDKRTSLAEAVSMIPEGAHLALGGFSVAGCPMAFVHELIRRGTGRLTLSQAVGGLDTDMLVGAGLVSTLLYGGGSLDRAGPLRRVNDAIARGSLRAIDHSSLSVALRYLAGAIGLPYIPTTTLLGTDILKGLVEAGEAVVAVDPFHGVRHVQLKPLRPDFAVLHVPVADPEGNCRLFGPTWDNTDKARAAERVIILAEEVVDTERFRESPESTVLWGFNVVAVVELPFSAHPTACYRRYDYDWEHLRLYSEMSATPEGFRQYLDRFVFGVRDHREYLERIGEDRLKKLVADPVRGY